MGVLSSATTALNAIALKRTLAIIGGGAMDMVWYSNLLSATALAPLVVLMGELPSVWHLVSKGLGGVDFEGEGMVSAAEKLAGRDALKTFLIGAAVTGLVSCLFAGWLSILTLVYCSVFGFLISIAGTLSIKVTSPVTHMVSSAVRGVFQTYLGVLLFADVITNGRFFGIVFIVRFHSIKLSSIPNFSLTFVLAQFSKIAWRKHLLWVISCNAVRKTNSSLAYYRYVLQEPTGSPTNAIYLVHCPERGKPHGDAFSTAHHHLSFTGDTQSGPW